MIIIKEFSTLKKAIALGTLLIAPCILGGVHSINANAATQRTNVQRIGATRHESYQVRANNYSQARKNARNPYQRIDGRYWTNRVNRAAYARRYYYHPTVSWNTRDLGGYYAGHGYYTRPDKVFRGADLHNISNRGVSTMHWLHINHIIDLRSHNYQGGKDKSISGISFSQYPVNTVKQKAYLKPYKARYGGEIYKYGTSFTTWSQPRWAYRQVFNQLLYHNNDGATYIHCIDGRDRTGIISALYLSALGVSKWNIYNDYLITNYYKYKHSYRNQVAELNRFYSTVNRQYGNINNYLHKGIGLSNHQLRKLRKMYLVKK